MPLTDAEYEDAYSEALQYLTAVGHDLGTPYRTSTGTRYCIVDGCRLNDEAVLAWWVEDRAGRPEQSERYR